MGIKFVKSMCFRARRDQPISIRTGHFQPPVFGPSEGLSCVLYNGCAQGYIFSITLPPTCTHPPGSRPQTLWVSTYFQQAAPFRDILFSRHILCPTEMVALYNTYTSINQNKYNVDDAHLDAFPNAIPGNEPSSAMLTSHKSE